MASECPLGIPSIGYGFMTGCEHYSTAVERSFAVRDSLPILSSPEKTRLEKLGAGVGLLHWPHFFIRPLSRVSLLPVISPPFRSVPPPVTAHTESELGEESYLDPGGPDFKNVVRCFLCRE